MPSSSKQIKFFHQEKPYSCAAACLRMVMATIGIERTEEEIRQLCHAGLYICPVESENPKKEKDWVRFEWVGVPPGKNIRANVWAGSDGAMRELYTDWGPDNDNGKPQGWPVNPGNHRIKLLLDSKSIRVWADSKQLCSAQYSFSFTSGYLYLQMSSGTNYPNREVYFDNIVVTTRETP